ncbi:MAG: hydroxyacid dehydrogenase [Luteitalea sp.]|nr:hydroxyacid dehydrogenase [Luteitalea sp.]
MKVLVADKFEQSGIDGLRAAGCLVLHQPDLDGESLMAAIRTSGAEVLVVRGTVVAAAMLENANLSLVVRAGAGYNTIDVMAASRRGIYVSNCPGKNAIAVAELTFGLILALDRRIADSVVELRHGRWNKKDFSKARGLYGRTLGLLGFGSIAQEVARRAAAFGMPVLVWSRRFSTQPPAAEAGPGIQVVASPEELAERADVLSVHLALTPDTRGLVNASLLGRLKPGSYVINTARGEIVDQAALELVIRERGIRAGLDVFAGEPSAATAAFKPPIVSLPNVYGTHHVGASTEQAQEAIAAEAVRVIATYKNSGKVPNVVNLAKKTPATHMLIARHLDRPGVLAHVFDRLRGAGINVQETENVIFEGAEAAVARINLDAAPPHGLLLSIRSGNDHILDLQVVQI